MHIDLIQLKLSITNSLIPLVPLAAPFSEQFLCLLAVCHRRTYINTGASQEGWKSCYNSAHCAVTFYSGDVALWTPTHVLGLCEKFTHNFIGLYVVIE